MMKKLSGKKFTVPKLAILGVVLLAITPLLRRWLEAALTAPCETIFDVKECGPDLNLRNASILDAAQVAWIVFGVSILVIGIILYIKYRK